MNTDSHIYRRICLFVIAGLVYAGNAQEKVSLESNYSAKSYIIYKTTKTKLSNTQQLTKELKKTNTDTYIWNIGTSSNDWEDLHNFLPQAKIDGISVRINLLAPNETPPICPSCNYSEPYRLDYMQWAQEIANLSLRYSNLKEFTIDNIQENLNMGYLTESYLNSIETKGESINPKLIFINDSSVPTFTEYYVNESNYKSFNWNQVTANDEVHFAAGTYNQTIYPKHGKLIADGEVILTGNNSIALYIQSASDLIVDGFDIRNGKTGNIVVAITSGSHNITLKNCKIIHPTAQAISIEGSSYDIKILSNNVTSGEVTNNYETDFVWMGDGSHDIEIAYNYILEQNSGTGHKDMVQGYNVSNAKIHHNFFAHYRNGEVLNYTGNIYLSTFSGLAQIYDNIIVYNGVTGNALILVGGGSAEVYNNTCYMLSGDRITEFSNLSSLKMRNNILYGNVSSSWIINLSNVNNQDIGNNLTGTNFNFAGGNLTDPNSFKLGTNSKAIDAGVPISLFNNDYFGTQRPLGNGWDVGAAENK